MSVGSYPGLSWRRVAISANSRLRRCLPPGSLRDRFSVFLDSIVERKKIPRLEGAELFNDHLLRLRSNGALLDPLRQFVSDKEYVKYYVSGVIGRDYTIDTIRILGCVEDIDRFSVAKVRYVIKPTHMSGNVFILRGANALVDAEVLKTWLRISYYRRSREANYRYLTPKIIVEDYFSADGITDPNDYKVFCFGECPRFIEVDVGRFGRHTRNFYDVVWNRIPFEVKYPGRWEDDVRPKRLDEMLEIASRLAKPFSSIRVDLYAHDDSVKVGELTNCDGGGTEEIRPGTAERWMGACFENSRANTTDGRPSIHGWSASHDTERGA